MRVMSDNRDSSPLHSRSTDVDSAQVIAAVDLGSNSFHMKVARVVDSQLSVIDRMRDPEAGDPREARRG